MQYGSNANGCYSADHHWGKTAGSISQCDVTGYELGLYAGIEVIQNQGIADTGGYICASKKKLDTQES